MVRSYLPTYICNNRWSDVKSLPGANRLIRHLHRHGIPFAIASNSLKNNILSKISYQPGMHIYSTLYNSLVHTYIYIYSILVVLLRLEGTFPRNCWRR